MCIRDSFEHGDGAARGVLPGLVAVVGQNDLIGVFCEDIQMCIRDRLTDAMKEKGYKLDELVDAGLSLRGKNGGLYDRFRNRLMFPIIDIRNNIIGFGGRVMDDSCCREISLCLGRQHYTEYLGHFCTDRVAYGHDMGQ